MEIKRGNKSQDGLLASKLSGGKKDFDFSQLNPLEWEFLGGDRKMDISGTWQKIKDRLGQDAADEWLAAQEPLMLVEPYAAQNTIAHAKF